MASPQNSPAIHAVDERLPRAHVKGRAVEAHGLSVLDPDFTAEIAATDDALEAGRICQEAFELGVRVRKLARASADSMHFAQKMDQLGETFAREAEHIARTLEASIEKATNDENGAIAVASRQAVTELGSLIEKAFDENDKRSAISLITRAATETVSDLTRRTTGTIASMMDADDPESPVARMGERLRKEVVAPVEGLVAQVQAVKEAVEVRSGVEAEQDKGTQKGRTYEESVQAIIEEIALGTGDAAQATGASSGAIPGCKVGDTVVEAAGTRGGSVKVVFEAKDRKLTLRKSNEELQKAADNRQAQVAVLVFSDQALAPTALPLTKIGPGRYVVVFDKLTQDPLALRLAYQVSHLEALDTLTIHDQEVGFDVVHSKIAEARDLLSNISRIEKGLNQADRGLSVSREYTVALKKDLARLLDDLEASISEQEPRGDT